MESSHKEESSTSEEIKQKANKKQYQNIKKQEKNTSTYLLQCNVSKKKNNMKY